MNINRQYVTNKNTNSGENKPKYIVIHETDNFKSGAGALQHAKAQSAGNLKSSVHFYCGSDGIYQVAEVNKSVWSIGVEYGGNHSVRDASNFNTINIEVCVNSDGNYDQARANAIELVKHLMQQYGITADRVIRHYDAKGKYCPRKMMDNPALWSDFKNRIAGGNTPAQPVTPPASNTGGSYQGSSIVDYLNSIGKDSSMANRKKLAAQYGIANYSGTSEQNLQLLNKMRSGASASKPSSPSGYTGSSIVDYLNSIGKPSDFNSRASYARQYGIANYSGTSEQNTRLLNAMRGSGSNTSTSSASFYGAFNSGSIVDGLKSIGVDESFSNRKKIAEANGISNYSGTASQNNKLCELARNGKLKKA